MPPQTSKTILLTGGARGIGRATARHLLSLPASHKLYILDISAAELAHTTHTHLAPYAPRVASRVTDLASPRDIRAAVAEAADWLGGRVDVLINNAGIARPNFTAGSGTMDDPATADEWQQYVATNLSAPFLVSQAVMPFMKAQNPAIEGRSGSAKHGEGRLDEGGCVVHVSSFRAHMSEPDCEGYGATKAGVLGLTHAMAVSARRWGIRVNAVSPGRVSVAHECREGDEEVKEMVGGGGKVGGEARMRVWEGKSGEGEHERHPVGRVGRGEDIAEAIEYLMGAGFVSGQEIVVDGGASKVKNPAEY